MLRQSANKLAFPLLAFVSLVVLFRYYQVFNKSNSAPAIFEPLDPVPSEPNQSPASPEGPSSTVPVPQIPTKVPEIIWNKAGAHGVSEEVEAWISSCTSRNPTYHHVILNDESADEYVRRKYSDRPDVLEIYLSLTIPILKADLLRYLLLYSEGGVYNDLDVECLDVSMDSWIPAEYQKETNLAVGLEFDWAWENDNFLHCQFASWTLMSKPGSRHILQVIEDILVDVRRVAKEYSVTIDQITLDMVGHVVDITGPKRLTRGIVKSLEHILRKTIDDRDLAGLKAPKLIGDVLILPGVAFAEMQSNYPKDEGPAFVRHHYAGTWKNDFGGELKNATNS